MAVWFLFERTGYSFPSVMSNALLLLVAILFFWSNSASLLNRPLTPLPNLEVSDVVVEKAADQAVVWINRVLAVGHDIAITRDRKVFIQVLSTLTDARSMKDRYPAYDKITSVLTTVSEELHEIPLFFSLHSISGTVKCTSPSVVMFRSAVLNAGYRISSTHVNPLGLKSDAPWDVIWDIMRCWVKNHPIKKQPRDSPGTAILSKSPKL